ncbi:MFS transporter [Actinospica durhamensis]|uniref:MFS transporter n=1 Tax=Actinospica durhamensis TaxID=1508375 RepID=A0A941EKI2_9ACTN|nr:MFS transporter [Actinospica durhamensis]MBR7832553.1 MFS transporter [Actinospica durhamensis]
MTDTKGVQAADAQTAERKKPGSLLRHRDFLLLWTGQTVSEAGTAVSTVALPLVAVTVLKASAFQVAMLTFLASLAFLLVSLPAGVVVDRVRRHSLMMWCDVARTVLVLSIPLTAVLWHVTLWLLYVVAGLVGLLTVFFDVAYQSYTPTLVGPQQIQDANAKIGMSREVSRLAGPAVAGALVDLIGAARALFIDAGSFAVSALSLFLIRTPEPAVTGGAARVPFRTAMNEGLGFVLKHPVLRMIVASTGTYNFFNQAGAAVYVLFLVRNLHASAAAVGLVFAAGAVGGVIGGSLSPRMARKFGSARIIWLAQLLPAPLYLLMPLAPAGTLGVVLFAIGYAADGFMVLVYNTAQLTYRQRECPPELLGRMNASVRWIVWGTIPLGALLGGGLATWAGVRTTVWVSTIGGILAVIWLLASPLRTMRDIPELPAD